jgi:MFS family permease
MDPGVSTTQRKDARRVEQDRKVTEETSRLHLPSDGDYGAVHGVSDIPILEAIIILTSPIRYLERVNVGQARLAGMQKDLGMTDKMWSTGISAYYIGYIISQLPATIWIAKGLPRYQIPCYVIAWSSVTACMAAMKSGWAFILCRFLVGFAEGPFLPIVSLITSSWYTKEEAPLRMAIWHAGNIGSSCLSGLLAAGIQLGMEGTLGIRGWKWFLIIEGKSTLAD